MIERMLSWVKLSHLLVLLIFQLLGGAVWATTVHINVQNNKEDIEDVKKILIEIPSMNKDIEYIKRFVIRMEDNFYDKNNKLD